MFHFVPSIKVFPYYKSSKIFPQQFLLRYRKKSKEFKISKIPAISYEHIPPMAYQRNSSRNHRTKRLFISTSGVKRKYHFRREAFVRLLIISENADTYFTDGARRLSHVVVTTRKRYADRREIKEKPEEKDGERIAAGYGKGTESVRGNGESRETAKETEINFVVEGRVYSEEMDAFERDWPRERGTQEKRIGEKVRPPLCARDNSEDIEAPWDWRATEFLPSLLSHGYETENLGLGVYTRHVGTCTYSWPRYDRHVREPTMLSSHRFFLVHHVFYKGAVPSCIIAAASLTPLQGVSSVL